MSAFAAAQTFTAGRTGLLDKVSLYSLQSSTVPVEISIQSVTATGAPSGIALASPTELLPPVIQSGTVDIDLTTPVPVTVGVKYALVIDWIGGVGSIAGTRSTVDPYVGGDVWYYKFDAFWSQEGLVTETTPDFLFTTWVL